MFEQVDVETYYDDVVWYTSDVNEKSIREYLNRKLCVVKFVMDWKLIQIEFVLSQCTVFVVGEWVFFLFLFDIDVELEKCGRWMNESNNRIMVGIINQFSTLQSARQYN